MTVGLPFCCWHWLVQDCVAFRYLRKKAETAHHLSFTVVSDRAGSRRIYWTDCYFY